MFAAINAKQSTLNDMRKEVDCYYAHLQHLPIVAISKEKAISFARNTKRYSMYPLIFHQNFMHGHVQAAHHSLQCCIHTNKHADRQIDRQPDRENGLA